MKGRSGDASNLAPDRVAAEFAKLESALEAAIEALAGTNEPAGRTPTRKLSFTDRVEMFDTLCRQRKPEVADESLHEDMIKRLVLLGDQRDRLKRSTVDSVGQASRAEPATETDLMALAAEMANTEGDVRSYLSSFRDVIEELR